MQKVARLGAGQGLHGHGEGARPGREQRAQLIRRGLRVVGGLGVRRQRMARVVEAAVALQAPAQRLLAVLLYECLPQGALASAQGSRAACLARQQRDSVSMQHQQDALAHSDASLQQEACSGQL